MRLLTIVTIGLFAATPLAAQDKTPTKLTYREKEVNGYLGGNADFPAAFVGQPLCEGGRPTSDAKTSCIQLNADGTGTWENDRGPGRVEPAAKINWYVVADQQGTVTKVGTPERDTYFLILDFTTEYYGAPVGTKRSYPANVIKETPGRVVIDSKYRVTG